MITACVITLNAADQLARCLASVTWCDEIVVVDGGSTDATAELARIWGAIVYHRPFDDFASQRNYALAVARHPWVMMVDADEVVTAALAHDIRQVMTTSRACAGHVVERRTQLFGHWQHRSEWLPRLFQRDAVQYVGVVHERPIVRGTLAPVFGILEHYSTPTVSAWIAKARQYIPLELTERRGRGDRFNWRDCVRPWMRFVRDYVGRGGWRDGWAGFVFASLSAYYDLLIAYGLWQDARA